MNEASLAGAVLSERSHDKRTRKQPYTGVVDGKRRKKFSLIKLSDGTIAELLGALRGRVFFRRNDPTCVDPIQMGWAWEDTVRYYPLPAAQTLGRLKVGKKERQSKKKAASNRRNGRKASSSHRKLAGPF